MATLYENYITGDDTGYIIALVVWEAQTFTPSVNHIISSVKLKLYRVGSPGTLTVSIRATTSDLPSGADLCVGAVGVDAVTLDTAGEWVEITFTAGALLVASTKYAIVTRILTHTPGNYLAWLADSSSPTYTDGVCCDCPDSGVTWAKVVGSDFMFEEWGDPQGSGGGGSIFPTDAITRVTNLIHRYSRLGGRVSYTLEMNLGEVTSDFGLPQWLSRPVVSVSGEVEEPTEPKIEIIITPPAIPPAPTVPDYTPIPGVPEFNPPPIPPEEQVPFEYALTFITCPICGQRIPLADVTKHLETHGLVKPRPSEPPPPGPVAPYPGTDICPKGYHVAYDNWDTKREHPFCVKD